MGLSLYKLPLLICLVLGWIFHHRTAWCLERRGDFVACMNQTVLEGILNDAGQIQFVYECIDNCRGSNHPYAVLTPLVEGYCKCMPNELDPGGVVPFRQCNFSCRGSPPESCGGDGLASMYTTSNRSCDDPGIPVNGSPIDNDFVFGREVNFTCSAGLVLDGPNASRCWWVDNVTLEIDWNPPPPSCFDPSSQLTTKGDTTSAPYMTSSTIEPPPTDMVAIIGGLVAVIVAIIIVVIIIVVMYKKRQKRRADISSKHGASPVPLSDYKHKPTQPPPKITGVGEDANGVEEEDYLVPDAEVVATAKKNSGQGQTLQLVGERPRLPAPPSVKASLSPEEFVYQNSITIALSRSKENVNKDTKDKEVRPSPAKQNRGDGNRHERTRATEGAVGKPPVVKASSLPLDTEGIYQNTQIAASKSSPRMPQAARIGDGKRGSRDSSGTASQRSSFNYRDSFDYVTPNEATEQEVYENAGVMRPRQGPRRPSDQHAKVSVAVDDRDSGGMYIDLI